VDRSPAGCPTKKVGDGGAVVVTDIEPRFLDGLAKGKRNVELVRHDIVRDALPRSAFDLIHARHVFVHLPDAGAILSKLKGSLKPGGWLVIEDFDPVIDRTVLMPDRSRHAASSSTNLPGWSERTALWHKNCGLDASL
jgi:SAM-dependent methyltransferase